MQFMKLPESM